MAQRRYSRRKKRKHDLSTTIVLLVALGIVAARLSISKGLLENTAVVVASAALALGILLALLVYYAYWRKQQALRAVAIEDVDRMSGIDFEQYVGALLKAQGYRVRYTAASGDYGVDIICKRSGVTTAVQVKRYTKPVGLSAVQQAVAGATHYKCTKAMVVTNNTFTKAARHLATSNACELVDRAKLGKFIMDLQKK